MSSSIGVPFPEPFLTAPSLGEPTEAEATVGSSRLTRRDICKKLATKQYGIKIKK